jgi:hypothetical protein
MLSNFR